MREYHYRWQRSWPAEYRSVSEQCLFRSLPCGRSWRALSYGSHRHERTCLLYDTRSAFFKEHGHIGPQPMSILLIADAGLYKTHSDSARRAHRRCGRRVLNRAGLICGETRPPYQGTVRSLVAATTGGLQCAQVNCGQAVSNTPAQGFGDSFPRSWW